jgi:hypothetical protein
LVLIFDLLELLVEVFNSLGVVDSVAHSFDRALSGVLGTKGFRGRRLVSCV